ncbi:hypothetical protein J2W40_003622 [Sphingobium xenophagum]|uniref:Uncharacterized protein n=1 Tax=Sphingobium xenophagum TaxID=121428 RepID=A0ABU1X5B7_SPHXE|nr:hypothetical protein [Sphingobium xenophagum]MDR7156777.1 hypothetical protein [Sphingobium xenophagum]
MPSVHVSTDIESGLGVVLSASLNRDEEPTSDLTYEHVVVDLTLV